MRVSKAALWISGGTLLVTILGIAPAYYVFFDKPDLVYELQIVRIPLPTGLPGQLPDSLAILTVQNTGHKPSTDMESSMTVSGELIDYQVQGPNPAFGVVTHSRNNSQINFHCSRLAPGDYSIKVSAWYKGATADPDIGVSDATGPGRGVGSISAEKGKYKQFSSVLLGLLAGSLGSLVAVASAIRLYKLKRSISSAARELQDKVETSKVDAEVGMSRNEPPGMN